jgi:hypothetical protein
MPWKDRGGTPSILGGQRQNLRGDNTKVIIEGCAGLCPIKERSATFQGRIQGYRDEQKSHHTRPYLSR